MTAVKQQPYRATTEAIRAAGKLANWKSQGRSKLSARSFIQSTHLGRAPTVTIQVSTKQNRSTKKGLNPRDQECFLEKIRSSDGDGVFQVRGQSRGHEEHLLGLGR